MDIRIKALHFDATAQLREFIEKKLDKLGRFADDIQAAEVTLKVVKPEVANNKEAAIRLIVSGGDLFADKIADSFEEATDICIDALKKQLERRKENTK
ncbi:MAG: ribosome-associated translation inhibitor RaiA [Porphyromonadaceae bacterium]|nr:ribosome-associated translation inhibitor RaiA [Porphyromonadaceae bacterium]